MMVMLMAVVFDEYNYVTDTFFTCAIQILFQLSPSFNSFVIIVIILDVSLLEEIWEGRERTQKKSWKRSHGTKENGRWT